MQNLAFIGNPCDVFGMNESDKLGDDPTLGKVLAGFQADNPALVKQLVPRLYQELRQLAHKKLYFERKNHTLNTTALVNEAYIKLSNQKETQWQSQEHFMATAARIMRHLLINYAERRNAQKRGGGKADLSLDEIPDVIDDERAEVLLRLEEALKALATFDERGAQIVEYRFFGGLSQQEIVDIMGISERTVRRSWMMAKTWIQKELQNNEVLS
ncbi:MAG: ECF-type sigma factor [Rhodothermales bacterium]